MYFLYGDHVPVLSSGEPVTTIGIGTGWQVARLRADAPLVLGFYEGDQFKQATVKAGREVQVRVRRAIPAQCETVLDNRVQHVVAAMANLNEAKALATRMNHQYGAKATVRERLSERPSGELTIVADDVVLGVAASYVRFTSDVPVEVLDVEYGAGYAWHGFENRKYWGKVYAVIDPDGAVAVQRRPEALKAQAVATRSTLLAKLGHRHLDHPYHLCSEQHCQVYAGASREDTRTTAAVQATRGQALFLGGHLVDALYSSNCGGHTEDNDAAWGNSPDPALRGRPDFDEHTPALQPFAEGLNANNMAHFVGTLEPAFCARVPQARPEKYRWQRTFGCDELDMTLSRNGIDVGALRDIVVQQRGHGGRVIELQLVGSERTTMLTRELPIRRFFGNLNSAAFVVDMQHDAQGRLTQVTFNGGGWGHGVGMCQLGAMGRAAACQTCEQILAYYYNGATLSHMYR
ncbi:stage II sporulation protein-domain-containing protein [Russula aff. rugulosa BPL654]|nr:stage II sporulation protein-domain-containing protein [Russula aff. rugulosa BPL654]